MDRFRIRSLHRPLARPFFGENARVKFDTEVTAYDMQKHNLILWGNPETNRILGQLHEQLPLMWRQEAIRLGDKRFTGQTLVPVMIYPNPQAPHRYVVINSGPTFRARS